MAKRPLLSPLIALLAGMGLGLSILGLKRYLAGELMALLEKEVKASCNCSLAYDSVNVSLLTLSAYGRNLSIREAGKDRLFFKQAKAVFSLAEIRKHKILLSELTLQDGYSVGVGPQTATYKFIDWLIAPLPPEKDTPDRWKLKLQRLKVRKGKFWEDFAGGRLQGLDASIDLQRTPNNDFELESATDISFADNESKRLFNLGRAAAEMFITDDFVSFRKLDLILGRASVNAGGVINIKQGNALQGEAHYLLDSESLALPPWIEAAIQGSAELSGNIGAIRATGALANVKDRPVLISQAKPLNLGERQTSQVQPPTTAPTSRRFGQEVLNPFLSFPALSGAYEFEFRDGWPLFIVSRLEANGAQALLSLRTPLQIKGRSISGALNFTADELKLSDLTLSKISSTLDIEGTLENLSLKVAGLVGRIKAKMLNISDTRFNAQYSGQELTFTLSKGGATDNSLSAHGRLKVAINAEPQEPSLELISLDFKLTGLDFPLLPRATLSGQGTLSGLLEAKSLSGTAKFAVSAGLTETTSPISGEALLRDGLLQATLQSQDDSLKAGLTLDFVSQRPGTLTLSLSDFSPLLFQPRMPAGQNQCARTTLEGNYTFTLSDPSSGNGALDLKSISLGCAPYELKLDQGMHLPIEGGVLKVPALKFSGPNTALRISGQVSTADGYRLQASGAMDLESFLPFAPAFEDLRGKLSIFCDIGGPLSTPAFSATAELQNAGFYLQTADISAQAVSGRIELGPTGLQVVQVNGKLNQGPFRAEGFINPFNLSRSRLDIRFEDVLFEPLPDASLTFSGTIRLAPDQNAQPSVSGAITISSAWLERNIDWATLLKALTRSIFSERGKEQNRRRSFTLPVLPLNISIGAPGNLLFSSNLAEAEMQAALHLAGTLAAPTLEGDLEIISGWFGLKDKRFEITSGTISFQPGTYDPALDIVGETIIRAREGDNTLVILELRGPLSAPRITLSSDRGLQEKEIITLLTSSSELTLQPRSRTLSQQLEFQPIPWAGTESMTTFGGFMRHLTKIDSLSIEPTFNSERGTFEPTLVARKQLFEKLALQAESSFGGGPNESRLKAIYEIFPALRLIGIADTAASQRNTALEANLAYTILSDWNRFLQTELNGNWSFPNAVILEEIRIRDSSRLTADDLPNVQDRVRAFYQKRGYFQTAVSADCPLKTPTHPAYCRRLILNIAEGPPSYVDAVRFEGDSLPPTIITSNLTQVPFRTLADDEYRQRVRQLLLQRLRSEGYLAARVEVAYQQAAGPRLQDLAVRVHLGDAVTFVFNGNQAFRAEEFLATIDLFKRKQPFGNNTINILIRNMDRMYREAGYLFCTISYIRTRDEPSARTIFQIHVNEGPQVKVREVTLRGNKSLSAAQIKQAVRQVSAQDYKRMFSPKFAIAEEIENNIELLKNIYSAQGFPNAQLAYQLLPANQGQTVTIAYQIEEGAVYQIDQLQVSGLPMAFIPPPQPTPPYSIPTANRYVEQLLEALKEEGYLSPQVASHFDPRFKRLSIEVLPGAQTVIHAIEIEGQQNVSRDTILRHLLVKAGEPWRPNQISQSKRRLLKLGLFSRVELEPRDGELNEAAEELLVKVSEREMRSFEIGAGVNSEYGLHIFGQATDRSYFADGRSLGLRVDTYYDRVQADISRGIASFTYADPEFIGPDQGLIEDLRFQRLDLSSYEFDLDRVSLSSYLHRLLNHHLNVSIGHTFLVENLSNVSNDAILTSLDSGNLRLSFLSGTFNYDARDYPLNPSRGWNLSGESQFSWQGIGSQADYFGIGGKLSYIKPLSFINERWSLAASLRGASAWTFGGTSYVPISQRYYLGGRNSIRGFRENSLGPRGSEGSVLGGDLLVAENLELRCLVAEATALHIFLDGGGLFLKRRSVAWQDIRESAGFGLSFLSPLGPVGVDIGFPLDERSGEPSFRVHFTIGTNF